MPPTKVGIISLRTTAGRTRFETFVGASATQAYCVVPTTSIGGCLAVREFDDLGRVWDGSGLIVWRGDMNEWFSDSAKSALSVVLFLASAFVAWSGACLVKKVARRGSGSTTT